MNIYTIIGKEKLHHITDKQIKTYSILVAIILIALAAAIWLLGEYQGRMKLKAEIKQAIKANEFRQVEDLYIFRSIKNQSYISTSKFREVADIEIAGAGDNTKQ